MTDPSGSDLATIVRRAGSGLRWALVGNVVLNAGSFAMSLIMVRLLAPHEQFQEV